MLGDESFLEQKGAELGAGLHRLDALQQLQRLACMVGLTLEKMVPGAASQVLGLADVERVSLGVTHDVHAGGGGQPVGERDLVEVAPRARLREAHHFLERIHALLLQPAQEQEQQLARGLGILQGAVYRLHAGVEPVAQGAQRAALLRAELPGHAQGVERRAGERLPSQAPELVVEEAEVEGGVVGHQYRTRGERREARQDYLHGRGVGHRDVVDAGDAGDHLGDGNARVHKRREGIDLLASLEAHGAYLGDLGEPGRGAGGLDVDDGEGNIGQIVALPAPGDQTHVRVALPAEALVAAHDVVDQLVHEIGRAVGDGEEARPHFAIVERFAGPARGGRKSRRPS